MCCIMFEVFKLDKIGGRHHVKVLATLEAAKAIVRSLRDYWPGVYLIVDQATGKTIEAIRDLKQNQA